MSLLVAIILGIIVGAVAGYAIQENLDLMPINIFMGIIGAVLGDAVYYFVSGNDYFLFTIGGMVSQIIGATLFVFIFSMIYRALANDGPPEKL